MPQESRRGYLLSQAGLLAAAVGAPLNGQAGQGANAASGRVGLPAYARAQDYTCLRQSSYDRTGGNADSFPMAPGATQEVFAADGPGVITHIWFTIAASSETHLKDLVLRIFWDGSAKPSVETPIGDFFGLNLGQYFLYQSMFLNCSPMKALNAYFAMPFRKSARITVTNEGAKKVGALYSNIDYQLAPTLPDDVLYFHAQYRQATPNSAEPFAAGAPELNLDGRRNYVFVEAKGKGQLLGVTLGVVQNRDEWMGEGDDMTFVDDPTKPVINGTGTEDYFCGAWDFGGRDGVNTFANLYCGAPYMVLPERTNGRYCLYRWHADNPITFRSYLKHSIEHGHANDRGDCFYSVAYWYQSEPYTDFPVLPALAQRLPALKI
jgi:hypothetical protein